MTKCHFLKFYNKKDLTLNFNGGDITSDAGLLLFKEFDNKICLTKRMSACIKDERDPRYVDYSIQDILTQRFYSWLAGYEDCNDAKELRNDPIIKAIVNRNNFNTPIASQSTLSRLENSVNMHDIYRLQKLLIDIFIQKYKKKPPKELIIDVDSTDDPTHGAQQLTLFNGYYYQYMYCPLIISCNNHILDALLRKGNAHTSWGVIPRLKFITGKLKEIWPNVKITIRIDAGGATPKIYEYCESNEFNYVIGLIKNNILDKAISEISSFAEILYKKEKKKQKIFDEIIYQAGTWSKPRRVIMKAEHNDKGSNKRFLVTNMEEVPPRVLYDMCYAPRGDFERIIGELKNGFKADRLSCHSFIANQFRLLLAVFQYELIELFSEQCLENTEFRNVEPETLRRALIKIGARVKVTVRRLWIECCSSCPYKNLIDIILNRIRNMPEFTY